jgi:transcriptional regulator with GAF, ATPase, and Fis domain
MAEGREQEIIRSFVALSGSVVDDFDIVELTTRLAEDCARLLDVAAVGLLLADAGGVLHLLAATSEHARSLEIFQLQREEGPCLDCYHSGEPVHCSDLSAETARWPRFVAAADREGFASVHVTPMRLRNKVLGALGLFGTTVGSLNPEDLNLSHALAHVASIAIVQQSAAVSEDMLISGLQSAIASRAVLDMAKGVIAEVCSLDMEQAFARLRSYAHQHDQHITEVARTIVSSEPQNRRALLAELDTPIQESLASPGRQLPSRA